jgi:hypothetical protein
MPSKEELINRSRLAVPKPNRAEELKAIAESSTKDETAEPNVEPE